MTELQRLTLVHEGGTGSNSSEGGYYRLAPGAPKQQDDDDAMTKQDAEKGKVKSGEAQKQSESAKDADDPQNVEDVQRGGDQVRKDAADTPNDDSQNHTNLNEKRRDDASDTTGQGQQQQGGGDKPGGNKGWFGLGGSDPL